tara:strand:- start:1079 stop:1246 length:168 start_codon:yes stop_codon:yes gene_type:complete
MNMGGKGEAIDNEFVRRFGEGLAMKGLSQCTTVWIGSLDGYARIHSLLQQSRNVQ